MYDEKFDARQNLVLQKGTGDKIKKTKILVIGAGAGGNEVLKNLVLMGFGHFTIIDFDPIEISNLSRTTLFSKSDIGKPKSEVAASRLIESALHSSPNIIGINSKIEEIGKQVFINHDIIISCVDDTNARAYINDCCVEFNKPFFEMGFEGFVIQVSFFPNETNQDPCLREYIGMGTFVKSRNSCSKLKMDDEELAHIPSIQVSAAFAGVFIATEIVLYLQEESKLKNKILQYAAAHHNVFKMNVERHNGCLIHSDTLKEYHYSQFDNSHTFRNVLECLKNEYNDDFEISFIEDNEGFVYSVDCEECGIIIPTRTFKNQMRDKDRWCSNCQEHYNIRAIGAEWRLVKEINLLNINHKSYLDIPIKEFGIKTNDVIFANSLFNDKKIFVLTN